MTFLIKFQNWFIGSLMNVTQMPLQRESFCKHFLTKLAHEFLFSLICIRFVTVISFCASTRRLSVCVTVRNLRASLFRWCLSCLLIRRIAETDGFRLLSLRLEAHVLSEVLLQFPTLPCSSSLGKLCKRYNLLAQDLHNNKLLTDYT